MKLTFFALHSRPFCESENASGDSSAQVPVSSQSTREPAEAEARHGETPSRLETRENASWRVAVSVNFEAFSRFS
jgi:hypothetical protein